MHFGVQAPNLAQMFVWTFQTVSEGVPKIGPSGGGGGGGKG